MIKYLALLAGAAVFLSGCASGLETEDTSNREPAPFSPDPAGYIPQNQNTDPLRGPTG